TLLNYLKLYNHHIPQRAIDNKTPILALKEWQQKRPELFVKRVYDQTGLDNYSVWAKEDFRQKNCSFVGK
ncbi:hypothetical protein AB4Z32_22305, partial [Massilia sp. 2TAF26]